MSLSSGRRLPESITAGVSVCRREESEQLAGGLSPRLVALAIMSSSALLFSGRVAPQALHAAADDHQEVVEVVRDAAGQLPDGLEMLACRSASSAASRRSASSCSLRVRLHATPMMMTAAGLRQAEDGMARHGREPFGADRRGLDPGDDINRNPSVCDSPNARSRHRSGLRHV